VRVSLDDIIAKTKISRRFLEAIEEGDYRQLPGGIFTVSYIRQYAEAVGYDPAGILEHYRAEVSETEPPADPRTEPSPSIARLARSILTS
jgi:cytoskeletal protein RodZ